MSDLGFVGGALIAGTLVYLRMMIKVRKLQRTIDKLSKEK